MLIRLVDAVANDAAIVSFDTLNPGDLFRFNNGRVVYEKVLHRHEKDEMGNKLYAYVELGTGHHFPAPTSDSVVCIKLEGHVTVEFAV